MTTPSTSMQAPTAAIPAPADYTRRAALALLAGAALTCLCLLVDEPVARAALRLQDGGDLRLGGDVRRTLQFLQQFGDLASSLIAGACVLLLDPAKRTRVLDWIVAALATSALVQVAKMAFGRPRPRVVFDPARSASGFESVPVVSFTPPWSTFDLVRPGADGPGLVERHAWEFWGGISSDLWSMPSSHTSAAMVLAVALHAMYPRLGVLVWTLAVIVGLSRVIFGAHFPSDVIAGATLGYAAATLAMHGRWGERAASRVLPRGPRAA
ncbi:MAG: phosphatase PAP2 family protein [Planctomycetota bacterium]|nr:phosphatase PAP2 family protein [Planctomycetota bacterium]